MPLYVSDNSTKALYQLELDGSNPTLLWTGSFAPYYPNYHAGTDKFFFSNGEWPEADIYSIDPNGDNETKIVDHVSATSGFDIDAGNEKIYYSLTDDDEIRRCDLDGGNSEIVLTPTGPYEVRLDVGAGKCYWTEINNAFILRDTIPGGGAQETVVTVGEAAIQQFDLDLVGGKIYWTPNAADTVRRSNLDGSNQETIVTAVGDIRGCAVDGVGEKVYWSVSGPKNVYRANLDGSDSEIIWSGVTFPIYLHVVNEPASSPGRRDPWIYSRSSTRLI